MQIDPPLPKHRTPALNALVLGAIVLAMVFGGTLVWKSWTRGSLTAIDEAHEAVVQPVETHAPTQGPRSAGTQPDEPGRNRPRPPE